MGRGSAVGLGGWAAGGACVCVGGGGAECIGARIRAGPENGKPGGKAERLVRKRRILGKTGGGGGRVERTAEGGKSGLELIVREDEGRMVD